MEYITYNIKVKTVDADFFRNTPMYDRKTGILNVKDETLIHLMINSLLVSKRKFFEKYSNTQLLNFEQYDDSITIGVNAKATHRHLPPEKAWYVARFLEEYRRTILRFSVMIQEYTELSRSKAINNAIDFFNISYPIEDALTKMVQRYEQKIDGI